MKVAFLSAASLLFFDTQPHKIAANPRQRAHYGNFGGRAAQAEEGASAQVQHGNVPLANEAGLDF